MWPRWRVSAALAALLSAPKRHAVFAAAARALGAPAALQGGAGTSFGACEPWLAHLQDQAGRLDDGLGARTAERAQAWDDRGPLELPFQALLQMSVQVEGLWPLPEPVSRSRARTPRALEDMSSLSQALGQFRNRVADTARRASATSAPSAWLWLWVVLPLLLCILVVVGAIKCSRGRGIDKPAAEDALLNSGGSGQGRGSTGPSAIGGTPPLPVPCSGIPEVQACGTGAGDAPSSWRNRAATMTTVAMGSRQSLDGPTFGRNSPIWAESRARAMSYGQESGVTSAPTALVPVSGRSALDSTLDSLNSAHVGTVPAGLPSGMPIAEPVGGELPGSGPLLTRTSMRSSLLSTSSSDEALMVPGQVPPICPLLISHRGWSSFSLPLRELAELGTAPANCCEVFGPSGYALLRAKLVESAAGEGQSTRYRLQINSASAAQRQALAHIEPQPLAPAPGARSSHGAAQVLSRAPEAGIFGLEGRRYGSLQAGDSGYPVRVVHQNGPLVMMITEETSSCLIVASSSSGKRLATAEIRGQAEAEGSPEVVVHVAKSVDPILAIMCTLSLVLLSAELRKKLRAACVAAAAATPRVGAGRP